jgi:hypothetical protein
MTNYNDEMIHGWNGGVCPVHPETEVKYWLRNMSIATETYRASGLRWTHRDESGDIIAFQVVKAYVEPKVIWVNETNGIIYDAYTSEEAARRTAYSHSTRIAVKYVEVKE